MNTIINARVPRTRLAFLAAAILTIVAFNAWAADFNNDGFADLAVGAITEEINSQIGAGMVMEVKGGALGITTEDHLWHQDAGIAESCEPNDYFGWALAVGDFDGDGYTDLAIGVPREELDGDQNAGVVHVLYGAASGLSFLGNQLFDQDNATTGSFAEPDDWFGAALAVGDFNNDGYDDLAIGSPYEDLGAVQDAGAVLVLFGAGSGLDAAGSQWIIQAEIVGTAELGDKFGSALAAADFDGDGFDDLAIGVPGQTVGSVTGAGVVNLKWGSATGLVASPDVDQWHQDRSGIAGSCEVDDGFGNNLAAGDFNADGFDDLVVGVWLEDIGTEVDAGAFHIIQGSPAGLTATGSQLLYQDNFGTNSSESGDKFGSSFTAADFNNDGYPDLVVGTPWEDWAAVVDVGMVQFIPGSAGGLDGASGVSITENNLLNGAAQSGGEQFGRALAAGDFNNDGFNDLAIGTPYEDLSGQTDAGTVYVLYGATTGLSMNNAYLDQCTAGYGGTCESDDLFGLSLAALPTPAGGGPEIFSNGFESGNTVAWSTTVP